MTQPNPSTDSGQMGYTPPPPPRQGPPWGKIFGCACGGCALIGIVLAVIFGFMAMSLKPTSLTPAQQPYVGSWSGGGATLNITAAGLGEFEQPGFSVAGPVTIDEAAKTITIKVFGITKMLKIDVPPTEGGSTMTLDGQVYTKSGGTSTSSTDDPPTNGPVPVPAPVSTEVDGTDGPDMPDPAEIRNMLERTIRRFHRSVQAKDFTEFYNASSKRLQLEASAAKMEQAFQSWTDKQIDLSSVSASSFEFDKAPEVDSDGDLVVDGRYPDPRFTFRVVYGWEENAWKVVGFRVTAPQ